MNESAIVEKLKTGSLIPDSFFGWSTKTILSGVVVILFLMKKKK